jgi:citrate synthase
MAEHWKAGLEDVIAARSAICAIDGEAGRLYYRGYEIAEVASSLGFEDTAWLLRAGERPSPAEARAFADALGAARGLPGGVLDALRRMPRDFHPLDALRTAVSLAAAYDPDAARGDEAANRPRRPGWWP